MTLHIGGKNLRINTNIAEDCPLYEGIYIERALSITNSIRL